ncbi:uncharacterized protein LOC106649116 [Trichogramma pretiosum]|uniref:uncharacterized protein LOC106649116 n=1 Tax=Trichogramma pretiosum TaxID=7493 RepID=UPI000C71964F|nr:uncharacterized protein LOC106649116 [Trichogramma pretiosum]
MKGLIFIAALLFVAVSANIFEDMLDDNDRECVHEQFAQASSDIEYDADFFRFLCCINGCDFFLEGAVYDNGTLNMPLIIKDFYDSGYVNGDVNLEEAITVTYHSCRKDYPNLCDFAMCMELRLDEYSPNNCSSKARARNGARLIKIRSARKIFSELTKKKIII